jgi:GT2 family glycosyltransferase
MEISFLIVTRNRPEDLRLTLRKLKDLIDIAIHEVHVFIDACSHTEALISDYKWVKWTVSKVQMSASPARAILYEKAAGAIFIGLDDDAHPISLNFTEAVRSRFRESESTGILAFQEVRGLFESDADACHQSRNGENHATNDFVGCGFAVRKDAYEDTNGFPKWIDIYGEESAVAIEAMDAGWDLIYCYDIQVNHRVDVEKRKLAGRNYFRFEHQLRNTLRFYLVYYKRPLLKILKTLFHNFKKYGRTDVKYFTSFCKVVSNTAWCLPLILRYRKPVKQVTIDKRNYLKSPDY